MQRIEDEFSGDMDVYRLISHPLKLVTYLQVQNDLNVGDAYELLEYLELHDELEFIRQRNERNNT